MYTPTVLGQQCWSLILCVRECQHAVLMHKVNESMLDTCVNAMLLSAALNKE